MSAEITTRNDTVSEVVNNNSAALDDNFSVSLQIPVMLRILDEMRDASTEEKIESLAAVLASDGVFAVVEPSSLISFGYKIDTTEAGHKTLFSSQGDTLESMAEKSIAYDRADSEVFDALFSMRDQFFAEGGLTQGIIFSPARKESVFCSGSFIYLYDLDLSRKRVNAVSLEYPGGEEGFKALIETINNRSKEPVDASHHVGVDTPIMFDKAGHLSTKDVLDLMAKNLEQYPPEKEGVLERQYDLAGEFERYQAKVQERVERVTELYREYLSACGDDLENGVADLCSVAMSILRGELSVDEALAKREKTKAVEMPVLPTLERDLPFERIGEKLADDYNVLLRDLKPLLQTLNIDPKDLPSRYIDNLLKQYPLRRGSGWSIERAAYLIFGRRTRVQKMLLKQIRQEVIMMSQQRNPQSVDSSQQPAISNQQPATRLQQPATRMQQSALRLQQPVTSSQLPVTRFRQPAIRTPQPALRNQRSATRLQQPATRLRQPATNQSPVRGLIKGALATEARRGVSRASGLTPVKRPSTTTAPRRGAIKTPQKTVINDNIIVNERQLLPVAASDPRRGATKTSHRLLLNRASEELRIKRELEKMRVAASLQDPLMQQYMLKHGTPTRGRVGNELPQSVTSSQLPVTRFRQPAIRTPQPALRNQRSATRLQQPATNQSPARGLIKGALATEARRGVSRASGLTPVTRPFTSTAPRRGAIKTPQKTVINDNIIVNERQLLPVAASDPRRGATKTSRRLLLNRASEELRIKKELQKMRIAASLQEPLKQQRIMRHGTPTRGRVGNELPQSVTSSQLPVTRFRQPATRTPQPALRHQRSATRLQQPATNQSPARGLIKGALATEARRGVSRASGLTPVTRSSTSTAPRRGAIKTPQKTVINDNIIVNERQLLPVAASDPRRGATKTSRRPTKELRIKRELEKMRVAASLQDPLMQQYMLKHGTPTRGRVGNELPQSAINKVPAQRVQQATEGSGARRAVPSGGRVSARSEGTPVNVTRTQHPAPSSQLPASRFRHPMIRYSPITNHPTTAQHTAIPESVTSNSYRDHLEQEDRIRYQSYLKARALKRSKQKLKKRERAIRESLEKMRIAAQMHQKMLEEPLEHKIDEAKKKRNSIERDTLIEFLQFLAESFGRPLELEEWRFSDERSIDIDLYMVLHTLGIDIEEIESIVAYIKAELSTMDEDKEEKFQKLLSLIMQSTLETAI